MQVKYLQNSPMVQIVTRGDQFPMTSYHKQAWKTCDRSVTALPFVPLREVEMHDFYFEAKDRAGMCIDQLLLPALSTIIWSYIPDRSWNLQDGEWIDVWYEEMWLQARILHFDKECSRVRIQLLGYETPPYSDCLPASLIKPFLSHSLGNI